MPSVTSLDQDMRKLRLERYTPSAANEIRSWIESTLSERLPDGDLLEALKDGVALCKLANLVIPSPGIKYKTSAMPFTQRENISHFLSACERPPLNMPSHDRFLTVDLYDGKDPAQVIQCLGAFSRAANAINPSRFPTTIGPRRGAPSPTRKTAEGSSHTTSTPTSHRPRGTSNTSMGSDSAFTTRSPAAVRPISPAVTHTSPPTRTPDASVLRSDSKVSSWSRREDENRTAPAWNIHQYGYMGGASQGNQGVSFGGRRQIIGNNVEVPNKAEKDARLHQREAEEEQARQRALEERIAEEKRMQAEAEAEEARARAEEQARWEQATREAQERERLQAEETALEEQRAKAEDQRKRQEAQRVREQEQREVDEEKQRRALWDAERRAQESAQPDAAPTPQSSNESERIRELERQLAEAKERERQYQLGSSSPAEPIKEVAGHDEDERLFLRQQHAAAQAEKATSTPTPPPRNVASPKLKHPFARPARPFEPPKAEPVQTIKPPFASAPSGATPSEHPYSSGPAASQNRTDRFLSSNPAPQATGPSSHYPSEMGMTSESERRAEDQRREASQAKTKAGGWASKSLLEREMERERERQREWEENQMRKMDGSGSKPLGPRAMGPRS